MKNISRTKFWIILGSVLLVIIVGLYLVLSKKIFADTQSKRGAKTPDQYENLLNAGIQFVPGEAIVKLKTSNNTEKSLETSLASKNVKSAKKVSDSTYKVSFTSTQELATKATVGTKAVNNTVINRILERRKSSAGKYIEKTFEEQQQLYATIRNINALSTSNDVEYAQPNYIYKNFALPNDQYINPSGDGKTWSSGSFGQSYPDLWGLKTINADKAWPIAQGNNVVVAVIDTGVDYLHEDLRTNVLTTQNDPRTVSIKQKGGTLESSGHVIGYNTVDNNNEVMDDNGHGTHVSGIIAAQMNNSIGIAGVAPLAKIMPVKVLNGNGYGTDDSVARGIIWAADNGAKIMNMSLGGSGQSKIIKDAIEYATSKNCLIIVAAGNSADDVSYYSPASDKNVLAVAATSETNQPTFFSNFGSNVSLSAPGGGSMSMVGASDWTQLIYDYNIDNILSLKSSGSNFPDDLTVGQKYIRLAGTSMATPYVAGAAAVVLSKHPEFSVNQLKSALIRSAKDVVDPYGDGRQMIGWDEATGYGVVDVQKALATIPNEMPQAEIYGNDYEIVSAQTMPALYQVNGVAAGSNFKNYKISVADLEFNNWAYLRNGFRTVYESATPVNNGVLASIPKAQLTTAGKAYSIIRVTVEGKDGIKSFDEKLLYRGTLEATGFPVMSDFQNSNTTVINKSATQKLITVYGPDGLYALNTDGTRAEGWKTWDKDAYIYNVYSVATTTGVDDVIIFYQKNSNINGLYTYKTFVRTFKANEGPLSLRAKTVEFANVGGGRLPAIIKGASNLIGMQTAANSGANEANRYKFVLYNMNGTIKASVPGVFYSYAVGKTAPEANEKVYLTGIAEVNGLVKQGVFMIDPYAASPKLTTIKLLSDRDGLNYVLSDISIGDANRDGKMEIGLGKYGMTQDTVMVLNTAGTALYQKSFNSDAAFWGMPGAFAYNFADLNNDNKAEFGYYSFADRSIKYFSLTGTQVASIRSKMAWGWIVANINKDPQPEIITTEFNDLAGFNAQMRFFNTSGVGIKSLSTQGMPFNPARVFNVNRASNKLIFDSASPQFTTIHQLEFAVPGDKLEWKTSTHDNRRTFCYNAAD